MKTVRTIFVTLELSTILAVALLAFMQVDSEYNFFKGIYITLFAILAKSNEWTEIEAFARKKEKWLRKYLELPNGIPSHDTIQRVISILNPSTLYSETINYLINKMDKITNEKEKDILSIDGKTSNGSKRENGDNKEEKPVNR